MEPCGRDVSVWVSWSGLTHRVHRRLQRSPTRNVRVLIPPVPSDDPTRKSNVNSDNCDRLFVVLLAVLFGSWANCTAAEQVPRTPGVNPPHISTDKSVKYGYDIVYVRAPRMVRGSDGKQANLPIRVAHLTRKEHAHDASRCLRE
jgi:hypothetical protein